jgi:hypothetical protein
MGLKAPKDTVMKKFGLYTTQGSSASLPADRIRCNNIVLPTDRHPGKTKLWVVFTAHGPTGAVWADSMEDALDELVDADLAGAILLDENHVAPEDEEHIARLGNNGAPCDLSDVVVEKVDFANQRNFELLLKLAEARGAGHDNLDF